MGVLEDGDILMRILNANQRFRDQWRKDHFLVVTKREMGRDGIMRITQEERRRKSKRSANRVVKLGPKLRRR